MFQRPMHWWIGGGILALVVSSLGLTTSWSYIKTAWLELGKGICKIPPIGFDHDRLGVMIQGLESEMRQNSKVVVQLEVEIEYQEKEVAKLKEEQEKAVAEMRKLREALGEGKSEFQFAGRTFTRPEVEQDLKRRLDVYQERDAGLKAKAQLLEHRRQTLTAVRQKAAEYKRQYDQLVAQHEALQAELKLLEVAQATGSVSVDGSKLAAAKELATEIEKKIEMARRLLDAERQTSYGEIPVNVDDRSGTERFDELFGPQETKKVNEKRT